MAATLDATVEFTARGTYRSGGTPAGASDRLAIGDGLAIAVSLIDFTYGTGTVLNAAGRIEVNDWIRTRVTLAATTTVSVDLIGSAYQNPFGVNLAFTAIKAIFAVLVTPDGSKKFRIGPQNVANAAQLCFGGVGAQAYIESCWYVPLIGPPAGWAITAGTADLLPLYNPGGSSIDVDLVVIGKK